MSWFEKASTEDLAHCHQLMAEHHPELHAAGVVVTIMLARNEDEHPLRVRGIPAAACIRVTRPLERSMGYGHALMLIDGNEWPHRSEMEQAAILDHELTHLQLVLDKKTGQVKEDDEGRPKLKLRPHDFEFGWFDAVAKRWPDTALEIQQARMLVDSADWVQSMLPGFEAEFTEAAATMIKPTKRKAKASA
jgi:hypothetical protein